MASHRDRIMENGRKILIVYAGPKNLSQHSTTDLAKGIMTNERKQSELYINDLPNILKLQVAVLYSIYQRAGKTSLFHSRGRFNAF